MCCLAQCHLNSGLVCVWERVEGYLLEVLLIKLRYAAVSPDPRAKQPFLLSCVAYRPCSSNLSSSLTTIQVGEGERGYLLELLLTKLRYAAVSPDPEAKPDAAHEGLQIIGMSATMPNVSAVASWLGAQLFQTDFRSSLYISTLVRHYWYIIVCVLWLLHCRFCNVAFCFVGLYIVQLVCLSLFIAQLTQHQLSLV